MKSLAATLLLLLSTSLGTLHASAVGAEMNAADAQLNQVYKKLAASIDDDAQKALLVAAQKAWIKARDTDIALFAARYEYSKGGLFYNLYLTQQRTKFLQALIDNEGGETEGPSDYMGE
jgi:uncharacterized protein YecT (DUF1311 family)